MPPMCKICGITEHCDIVSFKKTKEQEDFEKSRPKGWTGHPANLVWFCEKHIKIAEKYSNLGKEEAWPKIQKEVG